MKTKAILTLKIWVAIYPSIALVLYFFSRSMDALPIYLKTLLLTLILVP
ncbi:MAG: hypothetical protein AAF998_10335 [Bacteroidota bacterium]